jgi:transcriptional regulator with XRE-family HTH domain
MDPNPGPVLRRRQAGTRLRQLREAAGKSLAEVAAYLECSAAKISRIETGRLPARVPDVRNMLDLYQVSDPQRAELLDLVRESREKGWWHEYADILEGDTGVYLGLEDSAAQIWWYEAYLVPGLFQTREYAYAVHAPDVDSSEETVDRYVELRMRRQAILTRPHPPELHCVLDESVFHRAVALGTAVGKQQLDRLTEVAQRPNTTLQVRTYAAGLGATGGLPFTIFGFPDPADPRTVYAEGFLRPWVESKIASVARYVAAYDELRSVALDPVESMAFIAALAATLH